MNGSPDGANNSARTSAATRRQDDDQGDPPKAGPAAAAARLDAEREERERAARAVSRVDKAWLLGVLRDLIARIERDETISEDAAAIVEHREPPL